MKSTITPVSNYTENIVFLRWQMSRFGFSGSLEMCPHNNCFEVLNLNEAQLLHHPEISWCCDHAGPHQEIRAPSGWCHREALSIKGGVSAVKETKGCRHPPVHFRLERSTVSKFFYVQISEDLFTPACSQSSPGASSRPWGHEDVPHHGVGRELLRKAPPRVISVGQCFTGCLPSRISRFRKQAPRCAQRHPGPPPPPPITQTAVPVTTRTTPVCTHTKKEAWRRVSDTNP